MFRTSNIRGENRFNDLFSSSLDKSATQTLTKRQLTFIEQSAFITLGEKIELLLIALGHKLTGEIYLTIRYEWDEGQQIELPNSTDINNIEKLLKNLSFDYFQDELQKKDKQTGRQQKFVWFQVSVNGTVSHFMKSYPDDLTEFEEGVLYGFPLSAIRAFSGLIQPTHEKPTAASFNLAGVMSKEFWQDEQDYYQLWWERLRKLSPKIVAQAEEEFSSQNKIFRNTM